MSLLIIFDFSVTNLERFLVRDALRTNLGNYTWLDHSAHKQASQSVYQACHIKEPQESPSNPSAKNKRSTFSREIRQGEKPKSYCILTQRLHKVETAI